jgi:hypothetical protein
MDKVKISDDDILELKGGFNLNKNGVFNIISYQVKF